MGPPVMPGRLGVRATQPSGPRPFSSEWLAGETATEQPPTRLSFRLPDWIPDGRTLSAAMVVAISVVSAVLAFQGNRPSPEEQGAQSLAPATTAPAAPVVATAIPTLAAPEGVLDAASGAVSGAEAPAQPTAAFAQAADLPAGAESNVAIAPTDRAILPEYRVVTFYGHPHDSNMGIAGEISMEELATAVRNEAANYAAADPGRPVIPAFELIATVAQRVPGADGTYILDTDHETLKTYVDYAETQGMLVFLDLQIGRGTVADEIEKVRDLLARPNVHLALDPEFAVAEGQIPGEYIGSIPAENVIYAQQVLAEISAANGIPPKILIVHQFREDMIQGKEQLAPVPGVQLVIDADGYGAPELKTAVYNFLVRDEPVEFAGVKLFYRQDVPLMAPQEILALVPAPDVIIYQ
jgi:hypothetical protein